MKTIVNKMRFALLLGFVAIGVTVLAQGVPYINKMSISTQLFMEEMAGNLTFEQDAPVPKTTIPGMKPLPRMRRPIVDPDTIGDQAYISATVRITSDSDIAQLESEGVIVQCKFDHGLLTALIPVDRLEQVALLESVKRINVAAYMHQMTNLARQATNVDDVLTLSQDARDAGLLKKYDGSGVILGVIDDGIDFQHKAFTDKNGNTRIKRAYCYNGSTTTEWTGSGSLPTTDDSSEDHGTHTSSIAGGSSVVVSGTTVTVTDDHSTATYGGMAPGADLFLGGTQLANTAIMNSFQKMSQYADETGKPLVVSNSWGSTWGARDGYSDMSQVLSQYFGDNHPDRICLFAAGNEAGKANGGVGGGRYVTGTASQASPLGTIIRTESYIENYGYQYYPNILANAWTRATDCTGIGINIYVLNKSTGAIQYTYNYTSTNSSTQNSLTVSGLNMSMYVLFDYADAAPGRHQVMLYISNYKTTANYVLAIEVYPIGGSESTIDIYGGDCTYLTGNLTTNGHTWHYGTDDMSTGDEATDPNVISVGSYVTRNGTNSTGDISDFSSYATQGSGATGLMYPWITAPGEVIISGLNHYVSSSNHGTVTVNNSTAPYGEMSGTSMATPAAAGIVALWMEAAQEVGRSMTTSDIKEVMKQTAIRDSWVTSGTNASHFGNGKINALAGIEYILGSNSDPRITANPKTVDFGTVEPGTTNTTTISVGGSNLTGDITATLNDPSGVYSINTTNLGSGGNLVITYSPGTTGSHSATITLSSPGAEPVTITINGTAQIKSDATVCEGTATNQYLPVYGYYYDEAQANQMLYPSTKFTNTGMEGKKITKVTFYPTTYNNYSGINFYYQASRGNGTVTVKLANMPAGTTGYTNNSATRKEADFVTVKTITMPASAQTSLTEWVFEDLENDFTYTGGDLLIEVTTEAGMYAYTYFAGESQSSYTGMYSYGSTRRGQQFLPKVKFEWDANVEPITAGTVSPDALTFTDVRIGSSQEQAVTITNTGNQPFTPVIDTTNLPTEFTVTGGGQLLPNGTLDLTVTYTPTDEGPHSGSFTVTIGDVTYTVTVTGNGYIPNNTLYSNTVTVPVYKTELDVYGPYTYGQVVADIDRQLEGDVTNGLVKVQAKNIDAITDYRLFHNAGAQNNTVNMDNWASGNNQSSVAYAVHSIANDNFTTYEMSGNAWAQDAVYTFQNGEETMWIDLHDNIEVAGNVDTWYVPVTVASSKLGNENTYGSRMEQNPKSNSSVIVTVGYDDSSEHREYLDPATGMYYVYVTAQANIIAEIPTIEINGHSYEAVMARAWRYYKPYIVGQGQSSDYVLEQIGENTEIDGATGIVNCSIGSDSWTETNSNEGYLFNEYTFCVLDGEQGNVTVFARLYYKRNDVVTPASGLRLSGSDGGYFAMDGEGDMPDEPTSVSEYFNDKELVSVTFVNPQGMTSSRPFEGVNIIVKRYSDGSTSTSKVLNR